MYNMYDEKCGKVIVFMQMIPAIIATFNGSLPVVVYVSSYHCV